MTRKIRVTLPTPPTANKYWRSLTIKGQARVVVSAEAVAYKREVAAICNRVKKIDGPVAVTLDWFRPAKRGDLDNRIKVTLDALRGIAFDDDDQVVQITATRHDDKDNPRMVVTVSPAATAREVAA